MQHILVRIRTLLVTSWFPINKRQSTFKNEFLKKWKNSMQYTLSIAEQMPSDYYEYRPSSMMRSFGEQIAHIGMAITYISQSALPVRHTDFQGDIKNKEEVIRYLKNQYEEVSSKIADMEVSDFEDTTSFWAGRMTIRKILNITFDHITHHRAQAIVYMRIHGIAPPAYISW